MSGRAWTCRSVICLLSILPGCALTDPNHNEKIRWGMAQVHAGDVIKNAGADPRQYEQEVFTRKYYDRATHVVHVYELYDFMKTSPDPGPDRFVIAYDKATRKTYLRSDLRSNENLERLPVPVELTR
jgi:hypothetical protein